MLFTILHIIFTGAASLEVLAHTPPRVHHSPRPPRPSSHFFPSAAHLYMQPVAPANEKRGRGYAEENNKQYHCELRLDLRRSPCSSGLSLVVSDVSAVVPATARSCRYIMVTTHSLQPHNLLICTLLTPSASKSNLSVHMACTPYCSSSSTLCGQLTV